MDVSARYGELKEKFQERKKYFYNFINFLEVETSWLTSPAGTRFHLSEEVGLLKHSVSVAENLLRFRYEFAPAISEESCVIVGLFHDVGKIGMPGTPLYIPNENEQEFKKGIRYQINPEVADMGLALRSLYLTSQYMPISGAEAQAIAYHDGRNIDANNIVAHKEEPLTLLLHWADYWTARVYEEGRELKDDKGVYHLKQMGHVFS